MTTDAAPPEPAPENIVLLAQVGMKPDTAELVLFLRKEVPDPLAFCLNLVDLAVAFARDFRQKEQVQVPTIAVPKLHLPRRMR